MKARALSALAGSLVRFICFRCWIPSTNGTQRDGRIAAVMAGSGRSFDINTACLMDCKSE